MKKEVKYFVSDFDKINEGLEMIELDADAVINIINIPLSKSDYDFGKKQQVLVYYKN